MLVLLVVVYAALCIGQEFSSSYHFSVPIVDRMEENNQGDVCAYSPDKFFLTWNVKTPDTHQKTLLYDALGSSNLQGCKKLDVDITSNGQYFFIYLSTCGTHIWKTTDCKTFTVMNNPVTWETGHVYLGNTHFLQLYSRGTEAAVCDNGLATACKTHKLTEGDYMLAIKSIADNTTDCWLVWERNITKICVGGEPTIVGEGPQPVTEGTTPKLLSYTERTTADPVYVWSQGYDDIWYSPQTDIYTTSDLKSWTLQYKNKETYFRLVYVGPHGDALIAWANNYYPNEHPAGTSELRYSSDGFQTWQPVTVKGVDWVLPPYQIRYTSHTTPPQIYAADFHLLEPFTNTATIVGGSAGSLSWDTIFKPQYPAHLYPIVSIKGGTMLWAVEQASDCVATTYLSTDGVNWKVQSTLHNGTVAGDFAKEFPIGSGQVVALVHDCEREPKAKGGYGDMWYFPLAGSAARAHIKWPAPRYPALFHAMSYGLNNQLVAVGFPWNGRDDPQIGWKENVVWYGYSTTGTSWRVHNITDVLPQDCKFNWIWGLRLASNGKAIAYQVSDGLQTCFTTDEGTPKSFQVSSAKWQEFAVIEAQYPSGYFLASAPGSQGAPQSYYYSSDGDTWTGLTAQYATDCYGKGYSAPGTEGQGSGPAFGVYKNYVMAGGTKGQLCIYDNFEVSKLSGQLTGYKLPAVAVPPGVTFQPQAFGYLQVNGQEKFVVSGPDGEALGVAVFSRPNPE